MSGRRNVGFAFFVLDACVTGLALVGDHAKRGALYPLTLDYIHTGQMLSDRTIANFSASRVFDAPRWTKRCWC